MLWSCLLNACEKSTRQVRTAVASGLALTNMTFFYAASFEYLIHKNTTGHATLSWEILLYPTDNVHKSIQRIFRLRIVETRTPSSFGRVSVGPFVWTTANPQI